MCSWHDKKLSSISFYIDALRAHNVSAFNIQRSHSSSAAISLDPGVFTEALRHLHRVYDDAVKILSSAKYGRGTQEFKVVEKWYLSMKNFLEVLHSKANYVNLTESEVSEFRKVESMLSYFAKIIYSEVGTNYSKAYDIVSFAKNNQNGESRKLPAFGGSSFKESFSPALIFSGSKQKIVEVLDSTDMISEQLAAFGSNRGLIIDLRRETILPEFTGIKDEYYVIDIYAKDNSEKPIKSIFVSNSVPVESLVTLLNNVTDNVEEPSTFMIP